MARAVGGEGFKRCGRPGIWECNQRATLPNAELEEVRVRMNAVKMALVVMMNRKSSIFGHTEVGSVSKLVEAKH